MEDINMILNSADIPNLYASDEKGEIMDKIQGVAKAEQVSFGRWVRSGGIFMCGVYSYTKVSLILMSL